MFNNFLYEKTPKMGGLNHPVSLQVQRRYQFIKNTMVDYYARSALRPNNDHVLIQLLRSLSFSLELPVEEIWGSVYARSPYVAKHFGFTSPITFGRAHYKTFYGKDTSFKEFIFDTSLVDLDPYGDESKWRHLSPIRVLYHPVTDFHFLVPNGQSMPYNKNFSVTIVDVTLLVLQFHRFKQEQKFKFQDEAIITPGAFLTKEIFPKMFDSHVDLCVLNNFFSEGGFSKKEDYQRVPWPPVSFPDMTDNVKTVCTDLHKRTKKLPINYLETLQNLPVPVMGSAEKLLKLPRVPLTKQGSWVYWLARFRYMFELIRLEGDKGIKINKNLIVDLKRELTFFVNDRNYRNFNDKDIEEEFLYFFNYVSNL